MTRKSEEVNGIMTFLDHEYREIITKAVCGKGRRFVESTHSVSPSHRPSSILGCWVINHLYNAKKKSKDTVEVNGSYDINIWYSYNDNTKTEVVTEKITYCDNIKLSVKDDHCINDDYDVVAKVLQQPNCLECKITNQGSNIVVEIEREFLVQIIGDTKISVKVNPNGHNGDDDDDWDFEVSDDELDDIDPDFLQKKEND